SPPTSTATTRTTPSANTCSKKKQNTDATLKNTVSPTRSRAPSSCSPNRRRNCSFQRRFRVGRPPAGPYLRSGISSTHELRANYATLVRAHNRAHSPPPPELPAQAETPPQR